MVPPKRSSWNHPWQPWQLAARRPLRDGPTQGRMKHGKTEAGSIN